MKESDFVFDLVKSLDDKELRFVQDLARSRRRSPGKVLDLLEEFRKMDCYQPRRLKLAYSQYEVQKFKLKQLVMRALRLMENNETVEQEIALHLENEAILYRKGLYTAARRELGSARDLAESHQRLGRLLEILLLEQSRRIESASRNLETEVAEHAALICQTWERYGEEVRTMSRYQQLFACYRTHEKALAGSNGATLPANRSVPAFAPSFQSRLYALLEESLQARGKGDLAGAGDAIGRALELFEAHPHIRDRELRRYKILLSNYAVYQVPLRRFEQVREIIATLEAIEDPHFNDAAETFQNIAHLRLLLMLNTLNFSGLDELSEYLQCGLQRYGPKVNPARQFSFWYNQLILHFITESYEEADRLLSTIQDNKRIQIRKEVQYTTRLLRLIVWYELESWDPPDNAIAAAKQYLYRNEELSPFKQTVLSSISRLTATPVTERKEVYEEMIEALEAIRHDDAEQDRLGLEVVTAWARSKITGMSLAGCIRQERGLG